MVGGERGARRHRRRRRGTRRHRRHHSDVPTSTICKDAPREIVHAFLHGFHRACNRIAFGVRRVRRVRAPFDVCGHSADSLSRLISQSLQCVTRNRLLRVLEYAPARAAASQRAISQLRKD